MLDLLFLFFGIFDVLGFLMDNVGIGLELNIFEFNFGVVLLFVDVIVIEIFFVEFVVVSNFGIVEFVGIGLDVL